MFYLFGQKYVLNKVAKLVNSPYELGNLAPLKEAYNKFLSKNSIFKVSVAWDYPRIMNIQELINYAPKFCEEKMNFYDKNSIEMNQKISNQYFENALVELNSINPDLYMIINLLVRIIVVNKLKKYFEGTTDYTLGLSNMDLHDAHSKTDFQELLLHQTTHMIVFIDDRVNLQLPNPLKDFKVDANFDHKAGGNSFPLYIGYHSYLVGIEVLLHREFTETLSYNGKYHGTTHRIIQKCQLGRDLIMPYLERFTAHGQEIMLAANAQLDRIAHLVPITPHNMHYTSSEKIMQENNI